MSSTLTSSQWVAPAAAFPRLFSKLLGYKREVHFDFDRSAPWQPATHGVEPLEDCFFNPDEQTAAMHVRIPATALVGHFPQETVVAGILQTGTMEELIRCLTAQMNHPYTHVLGASGIQFLRKVLPENDMAAFAVVDTAIGMNGLCTANVGFSREGQAAAIGRITLGQRGAVPVNADSWPTEGTHIPQDRLYLLLPHDYHWRLLQDAWIRHPEDATFVGAIPDVHCLNGTLSPWLSVELGAQAIAYVGLHANGYGENRPVLFGGINEVTFFDEPVPGREIMAKVSVTELQPTTCIGTARLSQAGKLIAEMTLTGIMPALVAA